MRRNCRESPGQESWEKVNSTFTDLLQKLDFSLLAPCIIAVRLLSVVFNSIFISGEKYH